MIVRTSTHIAPAVNFLGVMIVFKNNQFAKEIDVRYNNH